MDTHRRGHGHTLPVYNARDRDGETFNFSHQSRPSRQTANLARGPSPSIVDFGGTVHREYQQPADSGSDRSHHSIDRPRRTSSRPRSAGSSRPGSGRRGPSPARSAAPSSVGTSIVNVVNGPGNVQPQVVVVADEEEEQHQRPKGFKALPDLWRRLNPTQRKVMWGLFIFAIATSLDTATVSQYITSATSSFDDHAVLGIVLTAQAIGVAAFRPFATKAYALMAAAPGVPLYAAGNVLGALGSSTLITLPGTAVFAYAPDLGDTSLLHAIFSLPSYVTGWLGSAMVDQVLGSVGWRWGIGMFCIITPLFVLPVAIVIFVAERRKEPAPHQVAASHLEEGHELGRSHARRLRIRGRALVSREGHFSEIDAIGLLLLTASMGGLFIPLTLVGAGGFTWTSPQFLVPIILGACAAVAYAWYETKARHPLFPLLVFTMRETITSFSANLLNLASYTLILTYQYSFIQVMFPNWSPLVQGFFSFVQLFATYVANFVFSLTIQRLVARHNLAQNDGTLKGWLLKQPMIWVCVGHALRVVSVGLMNRDAYGIAPVRGPPLQWLGGKLHSFHVSGKALTENIVQPLLWVSQILHGFGGSIGSIYIGQIVVAAANRGANKKMVDPAMIEATAEQRAKDVKMVGALNQLVADLGAAAGTAGATLLWRHFLPICLKSHLSELLPQGDIDSIYESTTTATSYDLGSDISNGIRGAYADVMSYLLYGALGTAVLSFIFTCCIGDAPLAEPKAPAAAELTERPMRRPSAGSQRSVRREMAIGHGNRRRREKNPRAARQGLSEKSDFYGDEEDRLVTHPRTHIRTHKKEYSDDSSLNSDESDFAYR
ncbi:hypothetical protein JCM11641_007414 [Rhodosporidiobolus odoratus]